MLEVLNDTVLADDFLNLLLGLDVEGVLVQQGNLLLALAIGLLLLATPHLKGLSPAGRVVDGGEQLGPGAP
jgi:hypothetical protein